MVGFCGAARGVRGEDFWGAARSVDEKERIRANVVSEKCMVAS